MAGNYDVPRAAVLTPDGGVVLVGRVASSGGADADVGIVKFAAARGCRHVASAPAGTASSVSSSMADHEEARDIARYSQTASMRGAG
ncbi:MAG: hypothetical protein U5L03_17775 [Burkholderiaceae bacterium]|nr:hypothetical protein [Burkholderiaceae bacterium]